MSENSESEVEVDPYEEIVDLNLNYSTPMASRTSVLTDILTIAVLFPVTKMNLARLTSTDP